MVAKEKYCEKKIHKLNKRLNRMKKNPKAYNNYDELYAKVVMKINSFTKAMG
jgi:uncharacterized coiled-coil DUF342 family protein